MPLSEHKIFSEAELIKKWGDYNEPFISICCITYNHESFLEDCLSGFFIQNTTFPFEVIIHDDASSDQTVSIIQKWQTKYPVIIKTILQKTNQFRQGKKPINFIKEKALGRYYAFCEGDDYWCLPDKLQKQVSFLENNVDFSCCFHDVNVKIQSSGKYIQRGNEDDISYSSSAMKKCRRMARICSLVYRREYDLHLESAEYNKVRNGDIFLTSMLGISGKGQYFGSYAGAVFRNNTESSWQHLREVEKEIYRANTFYWISKFYERRRDMGIAAYWGDKAIKVISRGVVSHEKLASTENKKMFYVGRSIPGEKSFLSCSPENEIAAARVFDEKILQNEKFLKLSIKSQLGEEFVVKHFLKGSCWLSPFLNIPEILQLVTRNFPNENYVFLNYDAEVWHKKAVDFYSGLLKIKIEDQQGLRVADLEKINWVRPGYLSDLIKYFFALRDQDCLVEKKSEMIVRFNSRQSALLDILKDSQVNYSLWL